MSAGTVESAAALLDRFREYQRTGDRRIRNALVEEHLHVADHYAKRYRNRGVPVEDLRQTALLAMIRAVDRFDPEAGVTFSTFASRTVDGELKRWFRDKAWMVRPPRSAQERHLALRRAEDELTHKLGRSPTVKELARRARRERGARPRGAGGRRGPERELARPPRSQRRTRRRARRSCPIVDRELGLVDERVVVEQLLDRLPERDRAVVELRFFEGLGQEEIATRIGVSQSYLSRMLRRILIDLRQMVDEPPADPG